jgi:predicted nucleic acid-binding protein
MPLVIDVSVIASWHFPDERNEKGDEILDVLGRDRACLPAIWWFELRNVLLNGERRQRATIADTLQFLDFVGRLPIETDGIPDQEAVFALARRHRLTFYDATYLELAQREQIALATLDDALIRAAGAEGIPLIGH